MPTVIIGGGVIGVCCAYELARRGLPVVLLERGRIAGEASEGNAGQMAIGHPPIPRPGLGFKAARWMVDPMGPLHISPRAGWGMAPWLWKFWRACSPRVLARSMETLAELGRRTAPMFDELIDAEAIACDYHKAGIMEVYRTRSGARTGRAHVDTLRRLGFDVVWLAGEEVRAREPVLRAGVVGAVYNRESMSLDPAAFVHGVARGARRLGAELREEAPIRRIVVSSGAVVGVELETGARIDAQRVVLAAGIWSDRLARTIGVRIPMQAGKGYHREIDPGTPPLTTPCVLAERFVACTPMNGRLRLAGTLEFTGVNHVLRQKRLDALSIAAREYLHGEVDATPDSDWCGMRPCVADGMPIIGPAPGVKGLLIATGHAMLGMTLGPITGRLVAELATGEAPSVDLSAVCADRF